MIVSKKWEPVHNIKVEFSKLTPADLGAVDALMKGHRQTLGFLPTEALREYLSKGGVLGAKDGGDRLMGYLLFAPSHSRFRIVQLCVSEEFRGHGIGKRLLQILKDSATTQTAIKLSCRRDFPAHHVWPKLGFVPVGEKPGRSAAGHLLTLWHLTLAPPHQRDLGLFEARMADETLDAIIDAQVFFDLDEPASATSEPSKALLSDFLIDSVNIWVTDEILNEINRSSSIEQRQLGRTRMQRFPQVNYSEHLLNSHADHLKKILPHHSPSQESDIRHLSKAASSSVNIFVTRDEGLLKKAQDIFALTNLQVVSPIELILQLHELLEGQSYAPDRVAGFVLGWHRVTSTDIDSLPIRSFLNKGERLGRFKETLNYFLASPDDYECALLKSRNEVVAVRVVPSNPERKFNVPLARLSNSTARALFARFVIADTIAKAVDRNLDSVTFEKSAVTPALIPDLLDIGFTECNDQFVRFCFSSCLEREEVLERITASRRESSTTYQNMSEHQLERHCSPLSLNTSQNYLLIPIRPGYALSLIDRNQSSQDLFGGDTSVLLRWSNVYYRSATSHRMLDAPGRLLWYVSGGRKEIIAVSHLDQVVIDIPKELLRRFKKFGILLWQDLYDMCNGDTSKKLMALQFSHTFLFRRPITLDVIRKIYKEDAVGLNLQSLSRIPPPTFHKLFRQGFPTN